jgi:HlyD family secretion protein
MTEKEPAGKERFQDKTFQGHTFSEQIDSLVVVITSKGWIALISLLALIVGVLVWSIVGTLPVLVMGSGITMTDRGTFNICTSQSGTVTSFPPEVGDWVMPDTLISKLSDPVLELQLKIAQARVDAFELLLQSVQQHGLDAVEKLFDLIAEKQLEIATQLNVVAPLNSEKSDAQELLLRDQEALYTGLRLKLKGLSSTEIISLIEMSRIDTEQEFQRLMQQQFALNVYSSASGQILETFYEQGDWVNAGDILAWVKYPLEADESHFFSTFFSVDEGQKIEVGMEAQIALHNVSTQLYGYLRGIVIETTEFPSSDRALLRRIRNPQIINFMKEGVPTVIRVVIRPHKDPQTFSGYSWTTAKGPPHFVRAGTVVEAKIILGESSPISYLLPFLSRNKEKGEPVNPDVMPTKLQDGIAQ